MFPLHEVFGNLRRKLSPPPQPETTPGRCVPSQVVVIPTHLSKYREDEEYLVVGDTASERTEIRPADQQDWVGTQSELPLGSGDCQPPTYCQPPPYEDVEARQRELGRGQLNPAADIPFMLHPLLQVAMDRAANVDGTTPRVEPLDLDKFLYDFTLEEDVRGNEARYQALNTLPPETVRDPTDR